MESLRETMDGVSQWMIPALILLIILTAAYRKVPMYESFVAGAKEGFDVAIMIIPYLVAILFVIKVFTASGIFADLSAGLAWAMTGCGLGDYTESLELLPLALTRPLSGGGARGVMVELFDKHGPDSFLGNTATLMMGSTETTFYVLTVYFGAINIKKIRHTLPACLIADAAGLTAAVVLGYLLFPLTSWDSYGTSFSFPSGTIARRYDRDCGACRSRRSGEATESHQRPARLRLPNENLP